MNSLLVAIVLCVQTTDQADASPSGTVWIPGGTFTMGASSDDARADEYPAHLVFVDGFFMTTTEVTNAQFKAFVDATGYVTTAELPVSWTELQKQVAPGTPKPDDELLQPGSMVFVQPPKGTSLHNIPARWQWIKGASWQHPTGPNSTLVEQLNHPVVHVSHFDAAAYAKWRGGALPSEAQWEYAARGGLETRAFTWGDAAIAPTHANVWQGTFPSHNTAKDGFLGTAPVGSFPKNAFGLFDMAGNVWEWTADRYHSNTYAMRVANADTNAHRNPLGPSTSKDQRNPYAKDVRVHRGGSFLCHASYCSSYRPAARMATTPDSALSHLGFRMVFTPAQAKAIPETSSATP
jgi:sulfatase modifying factor 1